MESHVPSGYAGEVAGVLLSSLVSWQWHRTGSRWSPVRTLPVAPLWCDLGFVPNSRGNKAAANLRPYVMKNNVSTVDHATSLANQV